MERRSKRAVNSTSECPSLARIAMTFLICLYLRTKRIFYVCFPIMNFLSGHVVAIYSSSSLP